MFTFDHRLETLINRLSINNLLMLLSRALMSYIFIIAGWNKIAGYASTAAYMESQGISGSLVFLVILLELGGGLALLFGYQARLIALLLALFSIASGLIFHAGPAEATSLMKNLAMAGGFIYIFSQGAGKFSIDYFLTKK